MRTLYIETSTEKSYIAIGDGENFISIPLPGGPDLSKRLALEVHILLKTNNFHPEQIAIGKGPGSLTGVRVGAALGKALAYGWGIPIVEFCSLRTFIPEEDGPFAVLVDVRIGGIYALFGVVEKGLLKECGEPKLFSPEDLESALKDILLLLSPHPDLIEKRIKRSCKEAFPKRVSLDLKPLDKLR